MGKLPKTSTIRQEKTVQKSKEFADHRPEKHNIPISNTLLSKTQPLTLREPTQLTNSNQIHNEGQEQPVSLLRMSTYPALHIRIRKNNHLYQGWAVLPSNFMIQILLLEFCFNPHLPEPPQLIQALQALYGLEGRECGEQTGLIPRLTGVPLIDFSSDDLPDFISIPVQFPLLHQQLVFDFFYFSIKYLQNLPNLQVCHAQQLLQFLTRFLVLGYQISFYGFLTHQAVLEVVHRQQVGESPRLHSVVSGVHLGTVVGLGLPPQGVVVQGGGARAKLGLKFLFELADAFGGLVAPLVGLEGGGGGVLPRLATLLGSDEALYGSGETVFWWRIGGVVRPEGKWILDSVLAVDTLDVGFEQSLIQDVDISGPKDGIFVGLCVHLIEGLAQHLVQLDLYLWDDRLAIANVGPRFGGAERLRPQRPIEPPSLQSRHFIICYLWIFKNYSSQYYFAIFPPPPSRTVG